MDSGGVGGGFAVDGLRHIIVEGTQGPTAHCRSRGWDGCAPTVVTRSSAGKGLWSTVVDGLAWCQDDGGGGLLVERLETARVEDYWLSVWRRRVWRIIG